MTVLGGPAGVIAVAAEARRAGADRQMGDSREVGDRLPLGDRLSAIADPLTHNGRLRVWTQLQRNRPTHHSQPGRSGETAVAEIDGAADLVSIGFGGGADVGAAEAGRVDPKRGVDSEVNTQPGAEADYTFGPVGDALVDEDRLAPRVEHEFDNPRHNEKARVAGDAALLEEHCARHGVHEG